MDEEFKAIMARILNTNGDFVENLAALVPLGTFAIRHYDVLLRLLEDAAAAAPASDGAAGEGES